MTGSEAVVLVIVVVVVVVTVAAMLRTGFLGELSALTSSQQPVGAPVEYHWLLTLHLDPERAGALVSRLALISGRLQPVDGPTPAWRADGWFPLITLEHTPHGSVLAVAEAAGPLSGPGLRLWVWLLHSVEIAAEHDGFPVTRSYRHLVQREQIGAEHWLFTPA